MSRITELKYIAMDMDLSSCNVNGAGQVSLLPRQRRVVTWATADTPLTTGRTRTSPPLPSTSTHVSTSFY